jgi:hypothetical protein
MSSPRLHYDYGDTTRTTHVDAGGRQTAFKELIGGWTNEFEKLNFCQVISSQTEPELDSSAKATLDIAFPVIL